MYSVRGVMVLLGVVMAMGGCATPRYQTIYRYEPPSDQAGRSCLNTCEQKLSRCQDHCAADYQACVNEIGPEVEKRYGAALKRYENELAIYQAERQRYELISLMNWNYPFWGPGRYSAWPGYYDFPPIPPTKPDHKYYFEQVQGEKCARDCGCQPLYDACFLGCGGKKIPEVRCIANCPKEK
jgi:hypothetical protein